MGVIDHDLNTDIIMSIEFIQIMFNSGNDIETVITQLSREKFGTVTHETKKILSDMQGGLSTEDALSKAVRETKSKNMKNLFASLVTPGPNINEILGDLSNHIIRDKQLFIQALEMKINNFVGWLLVIQVAPIVVYSLEIFKDIGGTTISNLIMNPGIRYGILSFDVIIILVLLYMLRGKQDASE